MQKVFYTNKTFQILLIVGLLAMLIFNLLSAIGGHYLSIIPILIQLGILALIFSENKHAKIAVKVWMIIIFISKGFSLLGKFIGLVGSRTFNSIIDGLVENIIMLLVAFLIYYYNDTTVKVT